jgi:hypothetical protein
MVKAPKEGLLMEKIKLNQPAAQPMNKKPNHPVVQPVADNAYHPYPVVQPVAEHENKPSMYPAGKKVTKSECQSHMHRYVEIQGVDGHCYDGIVEHVDDEWICLAVPGAVDHMRGFFPPSPFYHPYGSFYPYRPRRFERLALPLAGVTALSLLPYYW